MLSQFLAKQFIDIIQWNEPQDGVLSYRYPMQDMEIQNGGQLTVRESQMAAFINEGRIADVFGPGFYALTTRNLPLLTDLMNWDKAFESPFKSDVYFFSTRQQIDQKWGTATPITLRDKEFGAVRLRAFGNYAYRVADPHVFFNQVAGTRDAFFAGDLDGQLRTAIVAGMTNTFANSDVSFLDMAANQTALAARISDELKPMFAGFGLELSQFVVESVSLPEDLQQVIDGRIGVGIAGDLGKYTQFQAAQSLAVAAANTGGAAGMGVGLGAGVVMAQAVIGLAKPQSDPVPASPSFAAASSDASPASATKFCIDCGKPIPERARFCAECGKPQ
jgi:membrane protease subunit (stomatin/prohibitin family)